MDLQPYVESIQRQLEAAAQTGGDEARALAERLIAPLDSAIRLALQDALTAAADDITVDLAPGSIEIRLRGRDIEFVVTAAPVQASTSDAFDSGATTHASGESDEGGMSRINLRLPEQLKVRIERAAGNEALSVNAWLVRAAAARVEGTESPRQDAPRQARSSNRYTGWVR